MQYGFVLAMPGTMTCVAACWWCAGRSRTAAADRGASRAGRCCCSRWLRGSTFGPWRRPLQRTPRQSAPAVTALFARLPEQAAVLGEALTAIDSDLGEGQTLAVWPQGCMVNFLTRRKNPTPYIVLMPPEIAMFGEAKILESYRKDPPDFVLLLQCDTAEYGIGPFGEGYAQRIAAWLRTEYRPLRTFGQVPFVPRKPGAVLMARKDGFSGQPER